jgi:glycosyltransferase involved in cell wall biosynthesis
MGIDEEAIIVVDNGSSDGTCQALSSRYPGVQLIALKHNEGTSAWNYGFVSASREVILVLDDDAVPMEGACQEALSVLDAHQDVGIVACRISNHRYGNYWDTPYQPHRMSDLTDHFIFIGCAYFVRKALVNDGKVFDPAIVVADHEYPLAVRCLQRSLRIVYYPHVSALHRFDDPNGEHRKREDETKILRARHASYFFFCTGGIATKIKVAFWLLLQWVHLATDRCTLSDAMRLLDAFVWGLVQSIKTRKRYWPVSMRRMLILWGDIFPHLSFPLPPTIWLPWDSSPRLECLE